MKRADFQAVLEAASKSLRPRKVEQMTRAEQLRATADVMLAVASEVQRAYDEQRHGIAGYRLTRDDVASISRVALTLKHDADCWDWQQDPLVAQRMHAGLSVENVEGLPARPVAPKTGRAGIRDLPAGFPRFSLSWSEMAAEFLATRRGARGVDDARRVE